MAFKAKKKTKKMSTGRSRARPAQSRNQQVARARAFAPNRVPSADLKNKMGPNLRDLLHLHFKDKGYNAKTIKSTAWDGEVFGALRIELNDALPFRNLPFPSEVTSGVTFIIKENHVFHKLTPMDGDMLLIPMGPAEDPDLIPRMEGAMLAYREGAKQYRRLLMETM